MTNELKGFLGMTVDDWYVEMGGFDGNDVVCTMDPIAWQEPAKRYEVRKEDSVDTYDLVVDDEYRITKITFYGEDESGRVDTIIVGGQDA